MKHRKAAIFIGFAFVASFLVAVPQSQLPESDKIGNMRAFAKLYGYVRWFHPSDEAGRVDWSAFAVYGTGKVKNARTPRDLKAALEDLFRPIAPSVSVFEDREAPVSPQRLPEYSSALKPVAWQHLGMGNGTANGVYLSVRTNRENRVDVMNSQNFANLLQSLDIRPHRGEDIRLRAFVRTSAKDLEDRAQLWLRVDRENGQQGFFDNMADRPIRCREWKEYEIQGKIDSDAADLYFGCMSMGRGQIWVDEVRLWTREQGKEWKALKVPNGGFEDGLINGLPKEWGCQPQGYNYKVVEEDAKEGRACFSAEPFRQLIADKLFDKTPRPGEAIRKPLDRGLSCLVPLVLLSDGQGTVPHAGAAARRRLEKELNKIDVLILSANDENVRLGDAVIAWNVFEHFYPYFDTVKVDWDKVLSETLAGAFSDKGEKDFLKSLSRMVASLDDGHGYVWHPSLRKEAGLPIKAEWIENQVVVVATQDPSKFLRGDVVLSLDGKTSEPAVKDIESLVSGSPQWKRFRALSRFGYGNEGAIASLKIKRDGSVLDVACPRNVKTPVREPSRQKFEKLEDGVYIVNLTTASWDEIKAKINELAAAPGVVFDLRGYPNGNHNLISHLLVKPDKSSAWMKISRIIYPDQENIAGFNEMGWRMPVAQPHIKGRVVFLTNSSAISYSESFLGFVEHYKLGEIVGEPTAGANGNVNSFYLPGGFAINWTGMKVVKHDGSQHHLIGIRPTVPVHRTLRGVKEGRDEYLEKALEIIRKKKS